MDHGHMGHGHSLYEAELHVPLVFSWPARWGRGRVRRDLVCSADVMPAIVDLCGLRTPSSAGERPLFGGSAPAGRRQGRQHACVSVAGDFSTMQAQVVSLRSQTRKVIYDGRSDSHEMYDLAADPTESRNLAGDGIDPVFRAMRADLEQRLRPLMERPPSDVPLDPRVRRAFEALGYLERRSN